MYKSIYILPKLDSPDDDRVKGIIEAVQRIADDLKVPIVNEVTDTTLVIAIGGDGTMLEAMRKASNVGAIAMGINLGKVGFLTDFTSDHSVINHALRNAFANSDMFYIEERIGITMVRDNNFHINKPAFNEYVISTPNDGILIYKMYIGDKYAGVHKATALIISVPTGSTAYNLSAGGALILPSMKLFQIIPLAPLSLTSRPIIVPSDIPIKISFETNKTDYCSLNLLNVRADGVKILGANSPLKLTFSQYEKPVKLLHHKDWNFFNMLTEKLGWKNS